MVQSHDDRSINREALMNLAISLPFEEAALKEAFIS